MAAAPAAGGTDIAEEEREAMRAAVAAAHARGIEMLRQQGQAQGQGDGATPVQEMPDWFTERMLDGLAKYREGSRLGNRATTGSTPLATG